MVSPLQRKKTHKKPLITTCDHRRTAGRISRPIGLFAKALIDKKEEKSNLSIEYRSSL
mgnify:CR=1 FL=1